MRWLALTVIVFLISIATYSQSADKWTRVQTDDGSFSIDVPTEHKYLFSKQGFIVSRDQSDYLTSEMSMVTAYHEGTLLSVEVYEAVPAALSAIMDKDRNKEWQNEADERIGSTKVKVIRRKAMTHSRSRSISRRTERYSCFSLPRVPAALRR